MAVSPPAHDAGDVVTAALLQITQHAERLAVLASQAEWQTRLLPALAEQMYLETTRCQHARAAPGHRQAPTAAQATGNGHRHP